MSSELQLAEAVSEVLKSDFSIEVPAPEISLQPTKKEFKGTFTFVTFPFARRAKQNPEGLGNTIREIVAAKLNVVTGFNTVKGFLNFELDEAYWRRFLYELMDSDLGTRNIFYRDRAKSNGGIFFAKHATPFLPHPIRSKGGFKALPPKTNS